MESEQAKKEIAPYLETIKRREIIPIDCHIFTRTEFLEMLKVDYENLGKQIAIKNLPIHNINIFYKIIKKGIENGFKY